MKDIIKAPDGYKYELVDDNTVKLVKEDEKDYTVSSFKAVSLDEGNKNLIFGNGAEVMSRCEGDGVVVDKDKVEGIYLSRGAIIVLLKGAEPLTCDETLLWSGE